MRNRCDVGVARDARHLSIVIDVQRVRGETNDGQPLGEGRFSRITPPGDGDKQLQRGGAVVNGARLPAPEERAPVERAVYRRLRRRQLPPWAEFYEDQEGLSPRHRALWPARSNLSVRRQPTPSTQLVWSDPMAAPPERLPNAPAPQAVFAKAGKHRHCSTQGRDRTRGLAQVRYVVGELTFAPDRVLSNDRPATIAGQPRDTDGCPTLSFASFRGLSTLRQRVRLLRPEQLQIREHDAAD